MFEAYAIGVKLTLNNLISPQLALIAKDFEKLDGLTITFRESLAKISTDVTGLKDLARAANSTNQAFEKAGFSAAAFHRELAAIRATGGSMPRLPGAGGGGGGSGGGSGGGGSGGAHGGRMHVGTNGIGIGSAGFALGDWFWPLAAAGATVYAGSSLFQSAKDLNSEQARFRLLGMTEEQNQQAFAYAKGLNIYGTNQVDRLSAMREAQGVGRESNLSGADALKFAMMAAPTLAKLDALGAGLDGESAGALHQSNVALLRFAEQAGGLNDPAAFNRLATMAYKLRQSSGGTLDFNQLRNATANGGLYVQNMSAEGWAMAEPQLQEMGGSRYATAKTTAGVRMSGALAKPPSNLIAEMERLGLWTKDRHSLTQADAALYNESFEKFWIQRVMPAYDRLGITGTDRLREDYILGGRTGSRLAGLVEKNGASIARSFGAYQQAAGIDQATDQAKGSLSMQEQEFGKAWSDFKTNWGTTMLPFFTGILKGGSAILRSVPQDTGTRLLNSAALAPLGPFGSLLTGIGDILKMGSPGPSMLFAGKGGGMLHATINVDGKKMASAFVPYLTNPMTGAQVGPSGGDPLAYLPITGGSPF